MIQLSLSFTEENTTYDADMGTGNGALSLVKTGKLHRTTLMLFPMFDETAQVVGHSDGGRSLQSISNYQTLTSFQLSAYSGHLQSGSTLTFWGIK